MRCECCLHHQPSQVTATVTSPSPVHSCTHLIKGQESGRQDFPVELDAPILQGRILRRELIPFDVHCDAVGRPRDQHRRTTEGGINVVQRVVSTYGGGLNQIVARSIGEGNLDALRCQEFCGDLLEGRLDGRVHDRSRLSLTMNENE